MHRHVPRLGISKPACGACSKSGAWEVSWRLGDVLRLTDKMPFNQGFGKERKGLAARGQVVCKGVVVPIVQERLEDLRQEIWTQQAFFGEQLKVLAAASNKSQVHAGEARV